MRHLKKLLGGAFSVGLIAAGAYLWTPTSPEYSYTETSKRDVQIIRDQWGVPHVYGEKDIDVAFGLAYAHAEDDWATIQDTLLFSRGTLALEKGKEAAVTDYLIDLLKVNELVERKYETDLSGEVRALAEAYADGLTLFASKHPEKVAKGILPITGKDIAAGFVARTPFFYGFEDDLKKLTANTQQVPVSAKEVSFFYGDVPKDLIGSNAFAVAPSRSDDGHTRLMVNSHQPYEGPVAWYEARVKSNEGWDAIGSLFPGVPMILHGTNQNLGWAHTVNRPDLLDIYKLETDNPKKPTSYLFDGEWLALTKSKAKFRVKLFGPFSLPVKRDVLWTKHGPVMVTDHGVYAIRYAGMDNIKAIEQWFAMNKAENFDQWQEALSIRGIPSFNIIYADKEGNIAAYYNALIPNRQGGWNWRDYLPGTTSNTLWEDYVSFDSLPHTVNPTAGWVFDSNNTPFKASDPEEDIDPTRYPKAHGIETHLTNRAMRALAQYSVDPEITEKEFIAYRADHQYAPQSVLRKLVAEILADQSNPDLKEAYDILARWNGSADIENREAALAILMAVNAKGPLLREKDEDPIEALRKTATQLQATYGRLDPKWGEVNRLIRGDQNLPLNGGPDTLRAVYGRDTFDETSSLTAAAGDTYILYSDWDESGDLSVQTVHQFGSATLDETSPHFDDQAELFAREEFKKMPLTLDAVRAQATREYSPYDD